MNKMELLGLMCARGMIINSPPQWERKFFVEHGQICADSEMLRALGELMAAEVLTKTKDRESQGFPEPRHLTGHGPIGAMLAQSMTLPFAQNGFDNTQVNWVGFHKKYGRPIFEPYRPNVQAGSTIMVVMEMSTREVVDELFNLLQRQQLRIAAVISAFNSDNVNTGWLHVPHVINMFSFQEVEKAMGLR